LQIEGSKAGSLNGATRRRLRPILMTSLLPATEKLGRTKRIDLSTVAIFGVDDSKGGRYAVYFSPRAFSEFATVALAHGAQPSDRSAVERAFLLYGDERSARRLLAN